jgi:hypothetical protein
MSKTHNTICPICGFEGTTELPPGHNDSLLWLIIDGKVPVICQRCRPGVTDHGKARKGTFLRPAGLGGSAGTSRP